MIDVSCSATLGNALQWNRKISESRQIFGFGLCEVVVLLKKYYYIKDIIKRERAVRALQYLR